MKRVLVLVLFAAGCTTRGSGVMVDAGADAPTDAAAPTSDASLDLRPCIVWSAKLTPIPGKTCSIKMPAGAVANTGSTCTADQAHSGYMTCNDVYMDVFGRQGVLVADASECAFVQCAY